MTNIAQNDKTESPLKAAMRRTDEEFASHVGAPADQADYAQLDKAVRGTAVADFAAMLSSIEYCRGTVQRATNNISIATGTPAIPETEEDRTRIKPESPDRLTYLCNQMRELHRECTVLDVHVDELARRFDI